MIKIKIMCNLDKICRMCRQKCRFCIAKMWSDNLPQIRNYGFLKWRLQLQNIDHFDMGPYKGRLNQDNLKSEFALNLKICCLGNKIMIFFDGTSNKNITKGNKAHHIWHDFLQSIKAFRGSLKSEIFLGCTNDCCDLNLPGLGKNSEQLTQ